MAQKPKADVTNILRTLRSLDLPDVYFIGECLEIRRAELGAGSILDLSLSLKTRAEIKGKLEDLQNLLAQNYPHPWNKARQIRTITGNPYKGLAPLGPEDSVLFFGREAETRSLFHLICPEPSGEIASPLVLVVGASGSGKSSLVGAGLLPLLASGATPLSWVVAQMTPARDNDPLDALANALVRAFGWGGPDVVRIRHELRASLHSPRNLRETIDGNLAPGQRFLLWIDQLEELFTRVPESGRQQFLEILCGAVGAPFLAVGTLRAEFYHRCLEERDTLLQFLQCGHFPLGLPDEAALASIIECPAACVGVSVQPELVGRLIGDVGTEPGNLALLAFALEDIYLRYQIDQSPGREDARLELRDYQGLRGILGNRAEKVLACFTVHEIEAFERAFSTLVEVTEEGIPTRRRADRNTLDVRHPEARAVLDALVDARLLVADRSDSHSPALEVAHEAILNHWPRLQSLIGEQIRDLQLRHSLERQTLAWTHSGRSADFLTLRGDRLREALDWLERHPVASNDYPPTPDELQIKIPRAALRQLGLILGVTDPIDACQVSRNGDRLLVRAGEHNISLWDVTRGTSLVEIRERRYGMRTLSAQLSPDGCRILVRENEGWCIHEPGPDCRRLALGPEVELTDAAFTPDGRHLLGVGWILQEENEAETAIAAAWDVASGQRTHCRPISQGKRFLRVVVSPDGSRFATASSLGVGLWDSATFELITAPAQPLDCESTAFSPDGAILAAAGEGVRLWSAEGRELGKIYPECKAHSLSWSPDGRRLLFVSEKSVALYESPNWTRILEKAFPVPLAVAQFSLDGTALLLVTEQGRLLVVSTEDGHELPLTGEIPEKLGLASRGALPVLFSAETDGLHLWTYPAEASAFDEEGVRYGSIANFIRSCGRSQHALQRTLEERLEKALIAQSQLAATLSRGLTEAGLLMEALSLALDALPTTFDPPDRPLVPAAERALYRAWHQLREIAWFPLHGSWKPPFDIHGSLLAFATGQRIQVFDCARRERLSLFEQADGRVADKVNVIRFAAGGKYLLSAIRTICVWDPLTGAPKCRLEGHTNKVVEALFDPTGKFILSVDRDGALRLWNVASGKEVFSMTIPKPNVRTIAFSPDGTFFAAPIKDGIVGVWITRWRQWHLSLEGHEGEIRALGFRPDGRELATLGQDLKIRLWDLRTGVTRLIIPIEEALSQIFFSRDGKRVFAGPDSVWSTEDGTALPGYAESELHQEDVVEDSTGARLAVPIAAEVRLVDVETREIRHVFRGHTDKVKDVKFDTHGKYMISSSSRELVVWSSERDVTARDLPDQTHLAELSPDGRFLLTTPGYGDQLCVHDIHTARELRRIEIPGQRVNAASLSWNGRIVAAATNKEIRVWDLETGTQIARLQSPGEIVGLRMSTNGLRLVSLWEKEDEAGVFLAKPVAGSLWDLSNKKCFSLESTYRLSIAEFSLDGRYLATVDDPQKTLMKEIPKVLRLFELETGRLLCKTPHISGFPAIAFSRSGTLLGVSHFKGGFIINCSEAKQVAPLPHDHQIAFAADDRLLLLGEHSKVSLLDLQSRETVFHLHLPPGQGEGFSDFSIDLAGHILVARVALKIGEPGHHYRARAWNIRTQELLFEAGGVDEPIDTALLTPEGDHVITLSKKKGKVSIWPVFSSTEGLVGVARSYQTRKVQSERMQDLALIAAGERDTRSLSRG